MCVRDLFSTDGKDCLPLVVAKRRSSQSYKNDNALAMAHMTAADDPAATEQRRSMPLLHQAPYTLKCPRKKHDSQMCTFVNKIGCKSKIKCYNGNQWEQKENRGGHG